jgi:hypothetical protein
VAIGVHPWLKFFALPRLPPSFISARQFALKHIQFIPGFPVTV